MRYFDYTFLGQVIPHKLVRESNSHCIISNDILDQTFLPGLCEQFFCAMWCGTLAGGMEWRAPFALNHVSRALAGMAGRLSLAVTEKGTAYL